MSFATPRSFRLHLLATAVGILLGFSLIGGYAIFKFQRLLLEAHDARNRFAQIREQANRVQLNYAQQKLNWANLLLRGHEAKQYYRYLPVFYDSERRTLDAAQELSNRLGIAGQELQVHAEQFLENLEAVRRAHRAALEVYHQSANSPVAADRFLNTGLRDPAGELDVMVDLVERWHRDELRRIDEQLNAHRWLLGAGTSLWVVLSIIALAWLADRYYGRPLAAAVAAAEEIAAGHLEQRLAAGRAGEFAIFAAAFNSMMDRLASSDNQLRQNIARLEAEVARRSAAEQRLVVEQRALKAANEELEAFSYSVSHDLRAPLRAIDGFSRALQIDFGDRIGAEGSRNVDRVRAGAKRMGALIDDLLKISRVTRAPLQPARVNLTLLAQEIAEQLREAQPERHVEVVIAQGIEVRGDRGLLSIVLENLLNNAWKYTARRSVPRVEFGAMVQGDETVFFVRDNGVGFDMQYAGGLFGAFQRLHHAGDFPGNGIGLATAQRIVRRHGGRIWAEAAPDQGATFYFTLVEPGVESAAGVATAAHVDNQNT